MSIFAVPLAVVSFILAVPACASTPRSEVAPVTDAELAILRRADDTDPADPARWSREGNALVFVGQILPGECERFKRATAPGVRELWVTSTGGNAFEGLCIAREMRRFGFTATRVRGLCVSSCANYLFLASPEREIRNGIVGYHGDISALLHLDPEGKGILAAARKSGAPEDAARAAVEKFLARQRDQSRLELDFLGAIGVSQELFERSQAADKGVGDGRAYDFLLPTAETFARYGITGVRGEQAVRIGEMGGMHNVLR